MWQFQVSTGPIPLNVRYEFRSSDIFPRHCLFGNASIQAESMIKIYAPTDLSHGFRMFPRIEHYWDDIGSFKCPLEVKIWCGSEMLFFAQDDKITPKNRHL